MLHLFFLIGAVSGITALANGRGGTGWKYGLTALVGWLFMYRFMQIGGTPDIFCFITAWLFIGAVALYTRFVLGSNRATPGESWSCPDCFTLNQPSACICEACKKPWVPRGSSSEPNGARENDGGA